MASQHNFLGNTIVLTSGRLASYGFSFLRNIILARILSKADFGLAAVFGMAMTVLEVSGRMSFGQQVIQSKRGESEGFFNTAHTFQFLGGVCSTILLGSLSAPVAHLFKAPSASWALVALAVVPLCQGLNHLDVYRRQRHFEFLPSIAVDLIPQVVVTAATWPLALWFGDYRVIVWLMILKSVLGVAISFAFSKTKYRWEWHSTDAHAMLTFGWPLLLTGLVMFAAQQADQVLVGAVFPLDVLASYALAFSVVSIPYFIIGQVGTSLLLPLMARSQEDLPRLRLQYRTAAQLAAVCGSLCLLPLIISGEQIISLLYGPKYHGCGPFMALLGAAASIRFLRFAPAVAAIAKGDTLNQLYGNLWRSASLPLALGLSYFGASPIQIAGCSVVGEVIATFASTLLLETRQRLPHSDNRASTIFTMSVVSAACGIAVCGADRLGLFSITVLVLAVLGITALAAWFSFPEALRFLTSLWAKNGDRVHRQLLCT